MITSCSMDCLTDQYPILWQALIDMTTSGLGYIVGPLIGSLLYGVSLCWAQFHSLLWGTSGTWKLSITIERPLCCKQGRFALLLSQDFLMFLSLIAAVVYIDNHSNKEAFANSILVIGWKLQKMQRSCKRKDFPVYSNLVMKLRDVSHRVCILREFINMKTDLSFSKAFFIINSVSDHLSS